MTKLLHHIFYVTVILTTLFTSGCQKLSEDEIPSYLAVDTISVKVNSMQGTASQNIFDTWVYADNDLIGGFELPARMPILKAGTTELTIFAGIKLNGINETRVPYPFYESIKKTVSLVRDSVIDLGHLKFSYEDGTKFAWLENFEQYNITVDSTARSEVNLVRTYVPELAAAYPFELNEYAAKVVIPSDSLIFESISHDSFKLPTDGSSVFLEMNYKTNNAFTVGIVANGTVASQKAVLVINPNNNWNKIYINLTPSVSASTASSFRIYFSAMKSTDEDEAIIMFDNLKLLHF